MSKSVKTGIFFAVLAAALYAISAPLSKLLLAFMPSTLMAGFLYVGAGLGMGVIALLRKAKKTKTKENKLTKAELPYTIAMILLDIAAPICLLLGLQATTQLSPLSYSRKPSVCDCGWAYFSSRFPARCFLLKTFLAYAFPSARCLSCSPAFVGGLKTTAREKSRPKTRYKSCC